MHLLKQYVAANKIVSIAVLYFVISIGLKMGFSIDVLIPCLWKTLFHVQCPGCGLTRAFMQVLKLDFTGAFATNPLIFIILPMGICYVHRDFMKFKRRFECPSAANPTGRK